MLPPLAGRVKTVLVATSLCALLTLHVDSHALPLAVSSPEWQTMRDKQWQLYRYCPVCGHALHAAFRENVTFPVCTNPSCGFTFWEARTPRPVTTIFITRGSSRRILMTLRARDPDKGLLDFPGGFLQPGEHPFANARREMHEELQLHIRNIEHIGYAHDVYGNHGAPTLQIGLAATIAPSSVPRPADDVSAVRWVDPLGIDASQVFSAAGQLELLHTFLRKRGWSAALEQRAA